MHLEEAVITDYVDDALDAAGRAEVDRHLDGCAECRQLIADLREIRGVAGSLELREPPARAWARLERAIQLEQEHANDSARTRLPGLAALAGWRLSRSTAAWLAAAAVLVLATAVGVRYATHRSAVPVPTAAHEEPAANAAASQASAESIEAELRAAESHYDKAIKGLEQIATAEQSALDPATASTLRKNLAVIDQAISESRAAVRAEPASEPARDSLMESFRTKLALLQDTVALINEMRKGNEAGAARVVSGLKQKG